MIQLFGERMCDLWGCPASVICFPLHLPAPHRCSHSGFGGGSRVSWAQRRGVGRAKHNSWRIIVINFLPMVSQREPAQNQPDHCVVPRPFLRGNLGRYCRGRLLLLQPDLHIHLQEPLLSPHTLLGFGPAPFQESPGWAGEGRRASPSLGWANSISSRFWAAWGTEPSLEGAHSEEALQLLNQTRSTEKTPGRAGPGSPTPDLPDQGWQAKNFLANATTNTPSVSPGSPR